MKQTILVLAAVAAICAPTMAQEAGLLAADEAAIRKAVESYAAAFNRGDAKAAAAHWREDGEFRPPSGQVLRGRQEIEKEFEAFFAENPGAKVEVSVRSIRFAGPHVATESGTARVSRADEPPSETEYVATHMKQDGVWKMDSVREAAVVTSPSHYDQLKQLEWLIGEWIDQAEDSTIDTVCQWTKNKNFISRSFSVSIRDQVEIEGTQVIGWDPASKQIRSWMFDSDGCFGQSVWTSKENRWIIRGSRVLAGGESASAVNILTYVDDNTFTWKSTNREVDGQLLPNIDEVTVVRKGSGAGEGAQ